MVRLLRTGQRERKLRMVRPRMKKSRFLFTWMMIRAGLCHVMVVFFAKQSGLFATGHYSECGKF
jgi:hypothetical protein